ncbi:deoxyribose-phosphate aldolase [Desulfovibrio sp.]
MAPDRAELARRLDHTLLKPQATAAEVERLCAEALEHGFFSVCVAPCRIPQAARLLAGSAVLPITVIGFPLGFQSTPVKAFEAARAVEQGTREIDMVLNVGALKDRDEAAVAADIEAVARSCGAPVKVILETALLTDAEKVLACRLAAGAGAAFVKTCTGFSGGGATEADVRLLRANVPGHIGVKASGGIRTRAQALALLAAGADRLGASASVAIVTED